MEWARFAEQHFHRDRFRQYKVICFDECSHLSANVLDKISEVCQILGGATTGNIGFCMPFDGKRVILAGDALQLPPPIDNAKPFFTAKAFLDSRKFDVFYLQANHRSSVSVYNEVLNRIRVGQVTTDDIMTMNHNWGKNVCPKDILLAFAVSIRVSTKECKIQEFKKKFEEVMAVATPNHNVLQQYISERDRELQCKRVMYLSRFDELVDHRCLALLETLMNRLKIVHSNNSQCCPCFDDSFRTFQLDMLSEKDFCAQLINLYKNARIKCRCSFKEPLILVSRKMEVQMATQLLVELTPAELVANASDKVYCKNDEVRDENIIHRVRQALRDKQDQPPLPEKIVVAEGTPMIAAKTIKPLGLFKNGLGIVHGYGTYPYTLRYSRCLQKSHVWNFGARGTVQNVPNAQHTVEIRRITDSYSVSLDGTLYRLERTQFPVNSVLAVHTYVIQGQEIRRPIVVSLARNSQNELGINEGNAYTSLSRTTQPDDAFLVHEAVMKDFQVSNISGNFDAHHRKHRHSVVNYSFDGNGRVVVDEAVNGNPIPFHDDSDGSEEEYVIGDEEEDINSMLLHESRINREEYDSNFEKDAQP